MALNNARENNTRQKHTTSRQIKSSCSYTRAGLTRQKITIEIKTYWNTRAGRAQESFSSLPLFTFWKFRVKESKTKGVAIRTAWKIRKNLFYLLNFILEIFRPKAWQMKLYSICYFFLVDTFSKRLSGRKSSWGGVLSIKNSLAAR